MPRPGRNITTDPGEESAARGVIGPEFTDDERFAIIEYLKIHEDPADARGLSTAGVQPLGTGPVSAAPGTRPARIHRQLRRRRACRGGVDRRAARGRGIARPMRRSWGWRSRAAASGPRRSTWACCRRLSRTGLMPHVDYLSTVSGGGYIGSCLTWLRAHAPAQASRQARRDPARRWHRHRARLAACAWPLSDHRQGTVGLDAGGEHPVRHAAESLRAAAHLPAGHRARVRRLVRVRAGRRRSICPAPAR